MSARYLTLEDINIKRICTLGVRMLGLARNGTTIIRELREVGSKLNGSASYGEPRTNH